MVLCHNVYCGRHRTGSKRLNSPRLESQVSQEAEPRLPQPRVTAIRYQTRDFKSQLHGLCSECGEAAKTQLTEIPFLRSWQSLLHNCDAKLPSAAPSETRTPNLHRAKIAQYECGWKGGDRGGLAEPEKKDKITERTKTLDADRPSHGSVKRFVESVSYRK
jgi:hypothetical protein